MEQVLNYVKGATNYIVENVDDFWDTDSRDGYMAYGINDYTVTFTAGDVVLKKVSRQDLSDDVRECIDTELATEAVME